jgi:hypothetical protein
MGQSIGLAFILWWRVRIDPNGSRHLLFYVKGNEKQGGDPFFS